MSVGFEPIDAPLGAYVAGLELGQPLTADERSALLDGLTAFGVLVVRDMPLTAADLVQLGRSFGELEVLPEPDKRHPDHPEIFNLTNVRANGQVTEFDDPQAVFLRGTQRWHTDSSFRAVPCLCTMLHAVELPSAGGQTQFADMRLAWDRLPEGDKRRVADLDVVHSYEFSRANNPGELEPMSEEERAKYPPVTHPLVRTLDDGRRSIYAGGHASHIDGLDIDEGRALLADLVDDLHDPAVMYEHVWQVGDLVIWDNRSLLHRLMPYDIATEARVMQRVTVAGSAPPVRA